MGTIYVDMDGVLANLYDYLTIRILNKTYINTTDEELKQIKSLFRNKDLFNETFPEGAEGVFEMLEPYPFNRTLIETVVQAAGEYVILSRPSSLDLEGTSRAKRKWIETHLSFCPPKDVLLVHDKTSNNRARGNILIDDYDPFLASWGEKGGRAIAYKAWTFNSCEAITNYLNNKLYFSHK